MSSIIFQRYICELFIVLLLIINFLPIYILSKKSFEVKKISIIDSTLILMSKRAIDRDMNFMPNRLQINGHIVRCVAFRTHLCQSNRLFINIKLEFCGSLAVVSIAHFKGHQQYWLLFSKELSPQ